MHKEKWNFYIIYFTCTKNDKRANSNKFSMNALWLCPTVRN